METPQKRRKILDFFRIQAVVCLYSVSGIAAKSASNYEFLSLGFCLCYGFEILILAAYAIAWQQIIRAIPLTTAFANKAVTTAWGLVWGLLFFQEQITIGKLIGVTLVIAGVVLFSMADGRHE